MTTVQTGHWTPEGAILAGNPPQLSSSIMVPFASALELATNNASQTPFFIPMHCLNGFGATDNDFLRHANMYTQFRIKCIRFEFVPTTAFTSGATIPVTSDFPSAVTTDDTRVALDTNQVNSSTVWLIKWPNKSTGQFQDFGTNLNNAAINHIFNKSALMDPSVIKIPVTEKLVLTWKPKILGFKPLLFRGYNTIVSANATATQSVVPCAKKFPWMNIIDNTETATIPNPSEYTGVNVNTQQGGVNTTALRSQMSQPLLGMYDTVYDRFLEPTTFNITGRWYMHTVFEFKNKRHPHVPVSATEFAEGTLLYTEMGGPASADLTTSINRV